MSSGTVCKKRLRPNRKYYKLNYQILSPQLRLLDETGKQLGIVSKIEALQKARELNLDVVEIAPNAKPPVAKLIDFKKFKYQEAKKEQEEKRKQKNVGIKEIRLRPFMGDHDINVRVGQAKQFLEAGNQVKMNVMFRGREIIRKEFGAQLLDRIARDIKPKKVVREPHMEGRVMSMTMVGIEKSNESA